MRLGIAKALEHSSPDEWAHKHRSLGCGAVVFPIDYNSEDSLINAYVNAAKKYDLVIAEVGIWVNPICSDEKQREHNLERCINQLKLAQRIGAKCTVNIAGSCGEIWDGAYKENYSDAAFDKTVSSVQRIIDCAKPKDTFYTLEPMPWMYPDSPESYLDLIEAINREQFAVHLDIVNMITNPQKYFFNEAFMEECFKLLGDSIISCHVKDIRLEKHFTFNLSEVPCGEGNLNIVRYAHLANEVSEDMPFIIEHLDSDEEYIESAIYVKDLLKNEGIKFK